MSRSEIVVGVTVLAMLLLGCTLDRSAISPSVDGALLRNDAGSGTRDGGAREDAFVPADATPTDGGGQGDAAPPPEDAAIECTPWPWTPSGVDPCSTRIRPSLAIDAAGVWTLDTDLSRLESPGGGVLDLGGELLPAGSGAPARRVVSVAGLSVVMGAVVRVEGDAALVLLVHGEATVDGEMDVSARSADDGSSIAGPGAAPASGCSGGRGDDGDGRSSEKSSDGGGGGGGGGGFGRQGGSGTGGAGNNSGSGGPQGGVEGNESLNPLRGGCPGGVGGDGESGTGGTGGAAGGSLQIAARDALTVRGTLRAAGAGGQRGVMINGAGGGGGSGGGILLESDVLTIERNARVCANGGSGGEGATPGADGANGVLGSCDEMMGARTPDSRHDGGGGGEGGFASTDGRNGDGANNRAGGGGGGGGPGRIRLNARAPMIDMMSTLSPTPSQGPIG